MDRGRHIEKQDAGAKVYMAAGAKVYMAAAPRGTLKLPEDWGSVFLSHP